MKRYFAMLGRRAAVIPSRRVVSIHGLLHNNTEGNKRLRVAITETNSKGQQLDAVNHDLEFCPAETF